MVGEIENKPIYAKNVYEYHDGNVYLISDGHDLNVVPPVSLEGTDASGDDVFFNTADQLAPQDTDTDEDVYDARVDGGFPAPALAPECAGDACQGPLSPTPTLLAPGSEFQAGEAAPLAAPAPVVAPKPAVKAKGCRKGYAKKKSKCVVRHERGGKKRHRAKKGSVRS